MFKDKKSNDGTRKVFLNKSWLWLSIALCFMLSVFAPLETFFTNETEFWFSLFQLLPLLLMTFVISAVLVTAIFFFLQKSKLSMYIYSGIFCILLYLYIQGNYIPRNYGVFDGVDIEWDSFPLYATLSIALLLIFLALFILVVVKVKEKIFSIGKVVCIVLILTQVVTIGTLYIQSISSDKSAPNNTVVTTEGMLDLSDDHNILVFILDAFDSTYMQEVIDGKEKIEYKDTFSDFTYYPDTLGTYATTRTALPYILTGVWYENQKPYVDYVRDAHEESGLYPLLKENNYSVGVYTSPNYVGSDYDMYTNIEEGEYQIGSYLSFAAKVYKLVAFNYMPHQLKSLFYFDMDELGDLKVLSDGKEVFSSDVVSFYSCFTRDRVSLSEANNCFKVYHLYGVHPRYTFDETLTEDRSKTYDVYDEVAGNFRLMDMFMDELKEKGIYDNTTIIIMADHGQLGVYHQNPLFMIKNADEHHEFTVSQEPMSYEYLSDIFTAVASGDKVDEEFIKTCYKNDPERRFIYYLWERTWNKDYMPSMTEYVVDGHANDPDNLVRTGKHYLSGEMEYPYKLGNTLLFGEEATAKPHCVYGFSVTEKDITWTEGNEALMQFDISDKYENLSVKMSYTTYAELQHVNVYANEHKVASFVGRGVEEKEFIIPNEYVTDGKLSLRFELPDAVSPESRGQNTDFRKLALAMDDIVISSTDKAFQEEQLEIHPYALGDKLSFGNDATANDYCIYGFSVNEAEGTWTDGTEALMQLELEGEYENLSVKMKYGTYGAPQHVIVYADDNKVTEFVAYEGEEREFIVPKEFAENGWLNLRFELPDAVSPKEVEGKTDTRVLALYMNSLTISSTDDAYDENAQQNKVYKLGDKLSFMEKEATAKGYCISGFSVNEENGAWTDGKETLMQFNITEEYNNLSVKMKCGTFTPSQNVIIYANDHEVTKFVAKGYEEHVFTIPGEYVEDGSLYLRFELPDAVSPKDMGTGPDTRNLALSMEEITISAEE